MGFTMVKSYTDSQLIDRVKKINGFKNIPKGYWITIIKSNENTPDTFDDKLYLFQGSKCILVTTCTANTGTYGLLNFAKWNKKGAAIIKFDEWYYEAFQYGLHKGKMEALRQYSKFWMYRDGNKNNKAEEVGEPTLEFANTNLHCNDYKKRTGIKSWLIGQWSTGCIVCNNLGDYYGKLIPLFKGSTYKVPVCFINEF